MKSAGRGVARATMLAVLASCAGERPAGVDVRGPQLAGLTVSNVVRGDSLAFISLQPGSTNASGARVRNRRTGVERPVVLNDGGFEPTGLSASAGDSVEIILADRTGGVSTVLAAVPVRRPPVVVSTSPPRKRTDVPLNSIMVVVFSEPMSAATMDTGAIRLRRDGLVVPGVVTLSGDGLRAMFHPAHLLDPGHDYELEITTRAGDLDGEYLEQPLSIPFTTGQELEPNVRFTPDSVTVEQGIDVPLAVSATDRSGATVSRVSLTWTSSDDAIATVDSAGTVRGAAPGTVTIRATILGRTASARVTVVPLLFSSVSAGGGHTCGTTVGGSVVCWGSNASKQLGGNGPDSRVPVTAPVRGLAGVSAGLIHTCGFGPMLQCWGRVSAGSALVQASVWRSQRDSGSSIVVALSSGGHRSCAIMSDGVTGCWGNYWYGGMGIMFPSFLTIAGLPALVALSSGASHDCGLDAAGAAYCWGTNEYGQLGNGTLQSTIPWFNHPDSLFAPVTSVPVSGGIAFRSLSAGAEHTCGVDTDGGAWCWGRNSDGQLGSGSELAGSPLPRLVRGSTRYTSIAAGGRHTCAIAVGGRAWCWGANYYQQLGGGTTSGSDLPVPVAGDLIFATLSAGANHTCGITTSGLLYCWGDNSAGQLGNVPRRERSTN